MHSKSSYTYLRLFMLALTGVVAIVLPLAFGVHRSTAAPAMQGKTAGSALGQSRRIGEHRPPKRDQQLSYKSVNTSLDEIKLTNSDGDVDEDYPDYAGFRVAISGTTAVVGTLQQKTLVFQRYGDRWEHLQTLRVGGGEDLGAGQFGDAYGVAIDGETIVVGTIGSTYVYVREGRSWVLQATLPRPNNSHTFGQRLAISGDTIIVGDPRVDDDHGAVWIYERSGTTWSNPQKLTGSDRSTGPTERGDQFGYAVAIEGDTAVITAPVAVVVEGTEINGEQGAAYVYVRSGGTWIEQAYLTANEDELPYTRFMGASVDLSGDAAVIGNQDSDAAFVFVRNGTTWSEQQRFTASAGDSGNGFGVGVAISDDRIVIGEHLGDDRFGVAIIYDRTGETWFEGETLRPTTGEPSLGYIAFGYAVDISGDTILVGAPFEHVGLIDNLGAAYVFQKRDTDGDELPNDWEERGITVDAGTGRVLGVGHLAGGVFIDLPRMGAGPMHKDLFIHTDWMAHDPARPTYEFKPSPNAISIVIDSFAIAPVENPDGKMGINLHVDVGPSSIMNPATGEEWGTLSKAGQLPYSQSIGSDDANGNYNWSEVDNLKLTYFGPARRSAVFHYALFCNTYAGSGSSGLSRGLSANDFMVSFGHPSWSRPGGSVFQQAGTFMHELGHNLGLRHGGSDHTNRKPNYLSIMNYTFTQIGLLKPDSKRSFDYSREQLPQLNESLATGGLDENVGISDPAMHFTLWKCPPPGGEYYQRFLPAPALDWDLNGVKSPVPVAADINCDETQSTLTGFKDWPAIDFAGDGRIGDAGGASDPKQLSTPNDELPKEQLLASVPQALIDEEFAAPQEVVTYFPKTGAAPLPVNFDGSASSAVNGTIVNWQWDFGDGTSGSGATVTHTYATIGDYFASLTVTDSNGHVNLVPLLHRITVTNQHPNLSPLQPPGWSDKIVVSIATGTNIDSAELTINDVLYVDSAIINNGVSPTTSDFSSKLYLDDVEVLSSLTSAPLEVNSYTAVQDFAIGPLNAGSHTIRIVADANGAIFESDELDNEYSRVINITGATPTPSPSPTGQANLAPFQPPSWSDKIVVSNVTGTNADSATLNTTDTLYVDWAATNNGGSPTSGSFETKLYVDGVEKNTRVTSVTINPGGSFGVQDITIGSLSAGQHTVRIVLDAGAAITESNETDNEYIRVINVSPSPIGTNFTVTTTDDNGNDTTPTPGSLRHAILSANASPNPVGKVDLITFNIPGAGIKTIQPPIKLQRITDPVIIDGYTQPGASANTLSVGNNAVLLIELDIESVLPGGGGLAYGFDLRGTGGSTVRGLVINRFQSGGIFINSGNNVVEGCFIGSNVAGDTALPYNFPDNNHNNVYGIFINQGASNRIGGTSAAARNVIAPFDTAIVVGNPLSGATTDTLVQGNYIGTNAAGTATLNAGLTSGYGVSINGASNSTIGGTQLGAGNVISGNGIAGSGFGVSISSSATTGDVIIQGNLIGTNAQGTAAIRNADGGIYADGTITRLVIGGSQSGARNIISGNGVDRVNGREVLCAGIALYATVQNGATVQGNFIGTGIDGVTLIPNRVDGIGIAPVPNRSYTIGGVNAGEGNIIAGNARHGIQVVALPDGSAGTVAILGNSIFSNGGLSIFGNGGLGIDLQGFPENSFNVTRNDACDGDSGPNAVQNFPVLSAATRSTSVTTITGLLDSKAATTFRIEFFSNALCDGSGQGEGKTFIGSTTVTTGGSCSVGINVTLPSAVPVGQFISATATDAGGNTSEFGPCVQVTAAAPTASNTSVRGQITDNQGFSIAGVTINLTGTQNRLTITDGDGNYHFDNVETNGFYTVVPARANYSFIPAQRSFNALGSVTEAAFVARSTGGGLNPLDTTEYFVRRQYLDFLGREPDESGFAFWTNQIRACGDDASCLEVRRVNTSAAFFLSIEFQRTGYEVYRTYRSAYRGIPGAPVPIELDEFLCDTSKLGHGVVVNQAGWEQVLENNTQAFMNEFVQRSRFTTAFPSNMTPAQFVDALNMNADGALSASERNQLVSELTSGAKTRAQVLRAVAEDADLKAAEFNRAFVLMQFYGYLRRNPNAAPDSDYTGYDFWLGKLNQFNGNFMNAEMVKAFIVSGEYRQRSGP